MEWLLVTLSIYRRVFARAASLALKNWPVLLTLFAYNAIWMVAAMLTAPLGLAGGFIRSLVLAGCFSSFLYLVEMIVRTSRVTLDDFRRSFGEYLWDVTGIFFVSWIFFTIVTPVLGQLPQGGLFLLFLDIAIFVVFNAVPELIYLGRYPSLALLAESYAFIAANWIEWFPANLLAAAFLYLISQLPIEGPAEYLQSASLALVFYLVMVMRGLLFLELHGSTHRSRAFKYRVGG